MIVSNALLPDGAWPAFALAWGVVLAGNLLAGLGLAFTFKRSFIALPFFLAATSVLFSLPGQPLFSFGPAAWHLVVTQAGLVRFATIAARSWLSVQVAILLVSTTPFPDLLHALRHLHVPAILVSVISFMYRYLFVLSDEAIRLLRARQARSARLPGRPSGGPLAWRAQVVGGMAGQLFIRSLERSDRVYQAMLSRGYQGQLLTLHPHSLQRKDWAAAACVAACLVLIQAAARVVIR